jgi:hypothetical protein
MQIAINLDVDPARVSIDFQQLCKFLQHVVDFSLLAHEHTMQNKTDFKSFSSAVVLRSSCSREEESAYLLQNGSGAATGFVLLCGPLCISARSAVK